MSDELKPCPFCGGGLVVVDNGEICCPVEYEASVRCCDCDAQGPGAYRHDSVEGAIEEASLLWDTRHDIHTDLIAKADELAKALRETSQALAWQVHGECRGFSDKLLSPADALNLSIAALSAYTQVRDGK